MSDYIPLKALRAFEVTARHLSFGKAARELNVTTGAISQQVKTLEEFLGLQLFKRLPNGLQLTDAGRAGLPYLTQGFSNLSKGIHEIRDYGNIVPFTVWTTPPFATKWLVPRLKHFSKANPNIDLRINVSESMIESQDNRNKIDQNFFDDNEIDIAIMFGRAPQLGLVQKKLMSVSVVPLCSPDLLENGEHPLKKPEDLQYHTLLHDVTPYKGRPDWGVWLKKVGINNVDARHGLTFNRVSLVIQAAIEGQGVALGLMPLAQADVDSGRLVIPFEPSFELYYGYSIICKQEILNEVNYQLFYNWLTEQVDKQ